MALRRIKKIKYRLAMLFIMCVVAASLKITGGILYGSKSLLIDALTSMANVAALAATIKYFLKSLSPPDEDHHYGHRRFAYGGTIVTLMAYSFVGGVAVTELIRPHPYRVSINAPILAALGFLAYLAVILMSRRWGESFLPYSLFTVTELIESGVVIFSSTVGAIYSYIVDYIGAWGLTAYVFYELIEIGKETIIKVSDVAPPRTVIEKVVSLVRSTGLKPVRVRLRMIDESTLHGDIVVEVPKDLRVEELNELISKAESMVKRELNADVAIVTEASDAAGGGEFGREGGPNKED